jgi:hypothetical protein
MRFMVIVKASERSEAGELPSPELLARMGAFNEELVKAGMMLAAEGLHPTSKGARISFAGPKPVVTDGPFSETKELVGGYWIVQARSKEEIVAWMSRAPFQDGEEIELREIFELEDFGAALLEQTKRVRDQIAQGA